ncbi:uncharacterized protein L201_000386 [Kwoniella dendrophila CBS 6074]|uniref:F-box domain-containing protein n=1 Tax=Kwoniella dendrophila CBS 6074 TaxID=1295534 RepID=A0AAX4JJB1_9TREE
MSRRSAPPPSSTSSSSTSRFNPEEVYSPILKHLSLVPSFNDLSLSERSNNSHNGRLTTSSSSSSLNSPIPTSIKHKTYRNGIGIPNRMYAETPSSTSISSDEEEDDHDEYGINDQSKATINVEIEQAKSWLDMSTTTTHISKNHPSVTDVINRNKGKGKMQPMDDQQKEGSAAKLPPEILIQILRLLPKNKDLLSALLVSRSWCLCTFSLLWTKPQITSVETLIDIVRVISSDVDDLSLSSSITGTMNKTKEKKSTLLPYALTIKRLHLNQISNYLNDDLFLEFSRLKNLERLTISNCQNISTNTLIHVIRELNELTSIDCSNLNTTVNDLVVQELSYSAKNLQAINLSECKLLGDDGVLALAKGCKLLRRAKFSKCHRITPRSLIPLVQNCNLLLELDLQEVVSTSNSVIYSIFTNLTYLRELKLNGCTELNKDCIPNLIELKHLSENQLVDLTNSFNINLDHQEEEAEKVDQEHHNPEHQQQRIVNLITPKNDYLDHLRVVDFTGCTNLGDKAIENLIQNAPKLRTLTLTKCSKLTDDTLHSAEKLGKHLHYLHLGHVKLITDSGIIRLAKTCTRLRYIDLACCELLTDESIMELGVNMPKLKRVGLVKVIKITDESLYSLVERYTALERIHLSYCDNLSIRAISHMLNRLPHIKHLSLTGVSSFKKRELQQYCRAPPENFNEHQRAAFCVFSGHKVDELRRYLNEVYMISSIESDSTSTRRNSGSSSTSSITIPGTSSSPPAFLLPDQNHPCHPNSSWQPSTSNGNNYIQINGPNPSEVAVNNGYVYRRGSAPALRNHGISLGGDNSIQNVSVPGLPSMAFASPTPNFLTPSETLPSRSNRTSLSHDIGSAVIPSRIRRSHIPGGSIQMSSREGSASSVDERRHRLRSSHQQNHRERPQGPRDVASPSSTSSHDHPQHRTHNNESSRHNMPGSLWDDRSFSTANNNDSRRRNETLNSSSTNPNANSALNASAIGMRWFGWRGNDQNP